MNGDINSTGIVTTADPADSKLTLLAAETRAQIDHWVAKFPPGRQRSACIAALRAAQEQNHGYLTADLMDAVAEYLKLPPIQVYEVATFYSMFETHPCGRHHVSICTNISCMLNGAEELVAHAEKKLGIKPQREHARRPHLPQARGGMPRRLHRRADDDGRPRVPREPHPREARCDPGCPEVSDLESKYADRMNLMAFEPLQLERPWTLQTYRSIGGYQVWERLLAEKPPRDQIIEQVKASGLRGRGGAGFPTGTKWSFMPRNSPLQKYLVCNSDESEPGTCHDRDILRYNPHSVIEGLAIGGYATNSTVAYNYIRGEFLGEPVPRFEAALTEAYEAGLLGKNIRGSGIDFDLHAFVGAGAYICGEETGLLESLEGKPGKPRFKPPFPANFGLYGAPTTINNTLSFASVPTILRKGPAWFAGLGPANSGGTLIFSVSGHVARPRNLELPLGTAVRGPAGV